MGMEAQNIILHYRELHHLPATRWILTSRIRVVLEIPVDTRGMPTTTHEPQILTIVDGDLFARSNIAAGNGDNRVRTPHGNLVESSGWHARMIEKSDEAPVLVGINTHTPTTSTVGTAQLTHVEKKASISLASRAASADQPQLAQILAQHLSCGDVLVRNERQLARLHVSLQINLGGEMQTVVARSLVRAISLGADDCEFCVPARAPVTPHRTVTRTEVNDVGEHDSVGVVMPADIDHVVWPPNRDKHTRATHHGDDASLHNTFFLHLDIRVIDDHHFMLHFYLRAAEKNRVV